MLVLIGLFVFWLVTCVVANETLIIFFLGVLYGKFYFDRSENTRQRRWEGFQELMGQLIDFTKNRRLVDYKIVYHDEVENELGEYLSGEKSAIFSASPHSTISIGSFYHTHSSKKWMRGVTLCVHYLDFAFPFLREFSLWCGMMDVTRANIIKCLEENKSVYVVIGGTREMMSTTSDTKHRGLLEIAYQKGKLVFPVIHQGQEDVVKCYTTEWLDLYVRKPILGWTGYAFPSLFLPQRGRMTTHIFQPIDSSNEKFIESSHFIDHYYETIKKYELSLTQ